MAGQQDRAVLGWVQQNRGRVPVEMVEAIVVVQLGIQVRLLHIQDEAEAGLFAETGPPGEDLQLA